MRKCFVFQSLVHTRPPVGRHPCTSPTSRKPKFAPMLLRLKPGTIRRRRDIPQRFADFRGLLSAKHRHDVIHEFLLELHICHRHLQTAHRMLDMQLVLPVVDHDARLVRADALSDRSRDLRPQLCCRFDDLVCVFCWGSLAV